MKGSSANTKFHGQAQLKTMSQHSGSRKSILQSAGINNVNVSKQSSVTPKLPNRSDQRIDEGLSEMSHKSQKNLLRNMDQQSSTSGHMNFNPQLALSQQNSSIGRNNQDIEASNSRISSSKNLDTSNIALVHKKLNKIEVVEKTEECSLDDLDNLKNIENIMPDKNATRPFTAQGRSPRNQNKQQEKKKRIFSGVPPPTHGKNKNIQAPDVGGKSVGQTDLLEDLVGFVGGLDGDNDDGVELELGSDYPYAAEIQNSDDINYKNKQGANFQPSTNTTSYDFKNRDIHDIEMNNMKLKQDEGIQKHRQTFNNSNRGASLMDQQSLQQYVNINQRNSQKLKDKMDREAIDITTDHVIEVLQNSLYEPYSIEPTKFDIKQLIKIDRKVNQVILQDLEAKIQYKVNVQKRQLSKIFIDFGPYPLQKSWRITKKEQALIDAQSTANDVDEELGEKKKRRQRKASRTAQPNDQELFMPPDEDNFEDHGIKNLVIKFAEFGQILELDDQIHKKSLFYKKQMLAGVLPEFLEKLNQQIEPIKERLLSIDRFSMQFLLIGFLGTAFMAVLWSFLLRDPTVAIILVSVYVVSLALVFVRNNRELQKLQKSLMLNMAILVFLENQNVFLAKGMRIQIGFMGNWIEIIKEKKQSASKTMPKLNNFPSDATFKRNLQGLQDGGIYMNSRTMLKQANGGLGATLGPSRGSYNRANLPFDMRSQYSGFGFRSMQRPMSGNNSNYSSSLHGSPKKQMRGNLGNMDSRQKYYGLSSINESSSASRQSRHRNSQDNRQFTSKDPIQHEDIDSIEERDEDL